MTDDKTRYSEQIKHIQTEIDSIKDSVQDRIWIRTWWEVFISPSSISLYAILSCLLYFWIFKPIQPSRFELEKKLSEQNAQTIKDTVKGEIQTSFDQNLSVKVNQQVKGQLAAAKITSSGTSDLTREYIKELVKAEIDKQSKDAAKEEMDKLKADWKGDLFGQISFPVIFAITSIFAAFAVKDILTEILKGNEKAELLRKLNEKVNKFNTSLEQNITSKQEELEDSVHGKVEEEVKASLKLVDTRLRLLNYDFASITNELLSFYANSVDLTDEKFEELAIQGKYRVLNTLECLRNQNIDSENFHFDLFWAYERGYLAQVANVRKCDISIQKKIFSDESDPPSDTSKFSDIAIKANRLKLMVHELFERGVIDNVLQRKLNALILNYDSEFERMEGITNSEETAKSKIDQMDQSELSDFDNLK